MVRVLGDPIEIRVEGEAEHCERDQGLALENRAAKFLLQRDNGIGQRGLRKAAAFGRAGEITLLAERQKVADLVHLHVPPRGINRASRPRLPSAPVSKCEVVHTQRHTPWRSVGIDVKPINLLRDPAVIENSVAAFARAPNGGLMLTASALSGLHRDLIISLAARYKLPATYHERSYAAAGGLVSYGPNFLDQYRRAAGYIDRILKGEKPADLPVQAPT